jgi:adenine-specific DNA methylase
LTVRCGSATDLSSIPDGTLHNVTVDPPYYNNVNYAELSDLFYVWLKRSVGGLFPDYFAGELTNKDDEAVANPARFHEVVSSAAKKRELAEQDYERKMAAAFREMHRVLRPDGVLTVMFTHKRVEAWDTLATALISAGFAIKASWPVHTESEHSLHQAKKNAASSTILLVCRKRDGGDREPVWWEDIQGQVRAVARDKAREYMAQGMRGVDLYISTFGPTLSVISEHWPVLTSEIDPKTGQPKPLRPDTALDLAREEVIRLRKEGLLEGRNVQFDPVTDWYVMAWDAFGAEEFPYDEARKLAIALGLEMDSYVMTTKRIAAKKGQYVVMQQPAQRRKKGMVDPDLLTFSHWIDALHTAMLVYDEDGPGACDVFLLRTGLKRDATFKAVLQTLLNAIPRTQVKGQFVRSEAAVLDNIRLAFYAGELTAPPEVTIQGIEVVQLGMNLENGDEDLSFDEDE